MKDDKGDPEVLRAAFRSLATDARPTDRCPEPGKLWDGLRGELPPGELRDLVDHTASCGTCAEAWRLGLELEGGAAWEESASAAARKAAAGRPAAVWWRYAAVAALVVGALGVVQLGDWTNRGGPSPYRSAAGHGIVSLVPEDTPLAADALVLQWRLEDPAEVVRYEIRVMTEDLRPVAEARNLDHPSYRVPESELAALAPGARLLWRVEAVLTAGGRVESETFAVRLR